MAVCTSYNKCKPYQESTHDPPGHELALFVAVVRRVAAQAQQQVLGRRGRAALVAARGLLHRRVPSHHVRAVALHNSSGGFSGLLGGFARLLVAGPACEPERLITTAGYLKPRKKPNHAPSWHSRPQYRAARQPTQRPAAGSAAVSMARAQWSHDEVCIFFCENVTVLDKHWPCAN